MIVFVLDQGNRDEFGARFESTFPSLKGRFRVVDYGALAAVTSLPWATYVFFDLRRSSSGRVELAAELAAMLQGAGAPVFNAPSKGVGFGLSALAYSTSEFGAGGLFALRAEVPDSIAISDGLETGEDAHDLLSEWILDGTDPGRIQLLRGPAAPDKDGMYRLGGFLQVGQTQVFQPVLASRRWPVSFDESGLEPPCERRNLDGISANTNLPDRSIVRVEFDIVGSKPRGCTIDDGAGCLLRPPALNGEHRAQLEAALAELDSPDAPESPIPITWRNRLRPASPSS